MIILPESDEDLLRECEVETFRSSGPGGQHVNKTESAVRLRHVPWGVVNNCRKYLTGSLVLSYTKQLALTKRSVKETFQC